jgi:hypothetical protein
MEVRKSNLDFKHVHPLHWNYNLVGHWLREEGFQSHVQLFEEQHVDGEVLLRLTESDLKESPMNISKIGDIKKITASINKLKERQEILKS